MKIEHSRY